MGHSRAVSWIFAHHAVAADQRARPPTPKAAALPHARRVMSLVAAFALLGACDGGSGTSATPTAGQPAPSAHVTAGASPTTAPSPTEEPWNPIYGYDSGTSTGVTELDAVMAAISAGDLDLLAGRMLTRELQCSSSATVPTAVRCAPGMTEGSPVSIVFAEFCGGAVAFPAAEARATLRLLLDAGPRLWGARELSPTVPSSKRPGAPESRYVLFVVSHSDPPKAFTLLLGDDGRIHSLGYGCGERPEMVWQWWSTGTVVLLSPPEAPRPR